MTAQKIKAYQSLSRATIIIALFSLLSRIIGLLRDRALASTFGAGDALDIYYAAFRLPDFLFNLLILGTFSAAFIPVFTQYLLEDESRAVGIANTVLNLTAIIMSVLSGVLALFAPLFVALIVPGFTPEKQILTVQLTRIMLLTPIFFGVSSIFSGILNSKKRFATVAALPVIYNLSIIAGIFIFYPYWGMRGLAIGVALGAFLHMVVQIPAVRRSGFSWQPILRLGDSGVRKIIRLFIPRIFSMDLGQVGFFITSIVGSMLAAGTIAVYNLANNLQAVPIGVIAISFATVAFPSLSEAAAKGDKVHFRDIFNSNLSQIIYMIVPLSVMILVLRAQIVRLILGAGQFSWDDTIATISTLGFFCISLFAQGLNPLLARAYFSLQNTVTPVLIGIVSILINIVTAIYFSRVFGVSGLALSFSIATIANFLMLFIGLEFKFGNLIDGPLIIKIEKIVASTLLMGTFAYATLYLVEPFLNTRTFLGLFIQGGVAFLVGMITYLGFGWLLNLDESRHIVQSNKLWLNKIRVSFLRLPGWFQ